MNIIIKDMKKLLLSMLLGMASLFANAITWNSNYISIGIGKGDFSELIKLKTVITYTNPPDYKKGIYTFNTDGTILKLWLTNINQDGVVEAYDSEKNMYWITFTNLPNFGIVAIMLHRYGDDKYFLYDLMKK